MLFDQADRLRLSAYFLIRLRDQLGERDNQRSEAEGDIADLLDEVLRAACRILSSAAAELARNEPARLPELERKLKELVDAAQTQRTKPSVRLADSAAASIDVLAGQLRLVSQLVQRAGWADTGRELSRPELPNFKTQVAGWASTLRANLDVRSAVCRHAIRMSVCIAAAEWIERSIGWHRAYWLPMTVAVVLKPDFTATFSRGILRLLGTFAGLILATALFHVLPISALTQLLFVGIFSFCLRCWGPANYGILTMSVSGLIVFLIAAIGNPPDTVIASRALNTLAGGLLALLAYALWPTWERTQVSEEFAEMLDASRLYLQHLFSGLKTKHERLEWRRARSNVQASVDRVISEPGITALKRDTLLSMLASSHSLMLAVAGLGSRYERARRTAKANQGAPNLCTRHRFYALFFDSCFKRFAARKRKFAPTA